MHGKAQRLHHALTADLIELRDGFERATAAVGASSRELLRWAAACDRSELWRRDGCRAMPEWLSAMCGVSVWKARRWIVSAYALESLPLTEAALESGALSLDKTVELTRFATPGTEEKLIRWARGVSAARVREKGNEAVAKAAEQAAKAHGDRYLRWWSDDEADLLSIEGLLPAEAGAIFAAAIDRLADQLPSAPEPEDPSDAHARDEISIDQRRADALVLLTTSSDGDRAAEPNEVVLHAPIEALAHDERNCTVGRTVLHPETARRLSCDARLRVVLEDKNGDALGIGRASQIVPRWLRRHVLHRHQYRCSFPGCEMTRYLKMHHIEHWVPDGLTTYRNLVPVCHFHHALVHEHRWSVVLEGSTAVWFRPGGRRYDPVPPVPDAAPEPLPAEPIRLSEAAVSAGVWEMLWLSAPPDAPRYEPNPKLRRLRRQRHPMVEWVASMGYL